MQRKKRRKLKNEVEILDRVLWDGQISSEQLKLFILMRPIIEDMNRPEDAIILSWYEHTRWRWKQYEYWWVLSHIDLDSPQGKKVLDAGCGYTPLIRYLASIGMDAYGFDWDAKEHQSSLVKSSSLKYGDVVKYIKQDLRSINWESNFFDYTISVSVLEHISGTPNFLKKIINRFFPYKYKPFYTDYTRYVLEELIRITKIGGLIILTVDIGYGGGIPKFRVEKLFDVKIDNFPNIETIRSYWKADGYYSNKNKIYPGTPREYTSFLIVMRKTHA